MRSFSSYIMESVSSQLKKNIEETINFLEKKNKVLFLTTSNRWEKAADDIPKSTQLAQHIQELVGMKKIEIIDVSKLKIYVCEGNVSGANGNTCGLKDALLKEEIQRLNNGGIYDNEEIKNKIKKTYKNRYFMIINK